LSGAPLVDHQGASTWTLCDTCDSSKRNQVGWFDTVCVYVLSLGRKSKWQHGAGWVGLGRADSAFVVWAERHGRSLRYGSRTTWIYGVSTRAAAALSLLVDYIDVSVGLGSHSALSYVNWGLISALTHELRRTDTISITRLLPFLLHVARTAYLQESGTTLAPTVLDIGYVFEVGGGGADSFSQVFVALPWQRASGSQGFWHKQTTLDRQYHTSSRGDGLDHEAITLLHTPRGCDIDALEFGRLSQLGHLALAELHILILEPSELLVLSLQNESQHDGADSCEDHQANYDAQCHGVVVALAVVVGEWGPDTRHIADGVDEG